MRDIIFLAIMNIEIVLHLTWHNAEVNTMFYIDLVVVIVATFPKKNHLKEN